MAGGMGRWTLQESLGKHSLRHKEQSGAYLNEKRLCQESQGERRRLGSLSELGNTSPAS